MRLQFLDQFVLSLPCLSWLFPASLFHLFSLSQGSANFFLRGNAVNILGSWAIRYPTQLLNSATAVREQPERQNRNKWHGSVPIKHYLQKQSTGPWTVICSSLLLANWIKTCCVWFSEIDGKEWTELQSCIFLWIILLMVCATRLFCPLSSPCSPLFTPTSGIDPGGSVFQWLLILCEQGWVCAEESPEEAQESTSRAARGCVSTSLAALCSLPRTRPPSFLSTSSASAAHTTVRPSQAALVLPGSYCFLSAPPSRSQSASPLSSEATPQMAKLVPPPVVAPCHSAAQKRASVNRVCIPMSYHFVAV